MHNAPHAFLAARDAREAAIRAALARQPGREPAALVTLSLNIPGSDKDLPGCATLFNVAAAAVEEALAAQPAGRHTGRPLQAEATPMTAAGRHTGRPLRAEEADGNGKDVLGPFRIWHAGVEPETAKRATVAIETALTGGRLVDLDVYDASARQVDRAALGLPPRTCLLCDAPAHECARARRHSHDDLLSAVQRLLADTLAEALASALVRGAREELHLTPKPGLVDRLDHGSHPDLSWELMTRSVELLPQYYRELNSVVAASSHSPAAGSVLEACIAAGVRAERRMLDVVGSNAHRGYIFLSGLALLAARPAPRTTREYRDAVARLASDVLSGDRTASPASHGEDLRRLHGLQGIHGEALQGLPAVFEHALPALRAALGQGHGRERAALYAMSILMQRLEDTTAVHRCGLPGLERLRRDGRRIQALIEDGEDPRPTLAALNNDYRAARLTMGGVADCLALTLALEGSGVALPEDCA